MYGFASVASCRWENGRVLHLCRLYIAGQDQANLLSTFVPLGKSLGELLGMLANRSLPLHVPLYSKECDGDTPSVERELSISLHGMRPSLFRMVY